MRATAAVGEDLPDAVAVSIVVPVYGDGHALATLVERTTATLARRAGPWELILVDDGSPAATWRMVVDLAARDPHVRGVRLSRNFGQHGALIAGIHVARGEVIVTMDDDLQHPPEAIPSLLDALGPHDLVYGRPREEAHSSWRNGASVAFKAILKSVFEAPLARDVSAFRAFRARLARAFPTTRGPYVNLDVWLSWVTDHIGAIDVASQPRHHGRSHYSFSGLSDHALNMLTGFSAWPLRLATLIGVGCTTIGLVLLALIGIRVLLRASEVPSALFLTSIIALFSGVQLLALGIVGEYLARIHFRTADRPTYVIGAVTEDPARDDG